MIKGYAIIQETASGLSVNYEDFEVECFGGADYEATYTLDEYNREKLRKSLKAAGYAESLENMIKEHFGECLEKHSFAGYCDDRGIKYDLFTWIS